MFAQCREYYGKIRDRRWHMHVLEMSAFLTPILQLIVSIIVLAKLVILTRQTGDNKIIRYPSVVHIS